MIQAGEPGRNPPAPPATDRDAVTLPERAEGENGLEAAEVEGALFTPPPPPSFPRILPGL